jgi:ABC-2 type transport system ATP-binding protein
MAYPHLTGEENLRHACLLKAVPRRDATRVLGIVHLSSDSHRLVKEYSLGMKQRLGLAQALLGQPELIVLDEPTNGLDPAGIQEMRHLLRDMPAAHGVTVFLSSHLLSEVEKIATQVGIVCNGRMRFQGSPEELRSRQQMELRIGVDRPDAAAELIRKQGWDATAEERSTVLVRPATSETAVRLNRFLVERGFAVHSLTTEQPSLEALFLDLTKAVQS